METFSLGTSALKASQLAYGCWRIGGPGESSEITLEREAAGSRASLAAFEAGYTLFDLADIYCHGEAERIFGKVLKSIPGMRERILIVSKCGIRKAGDPDADSPYRYDFSAGHIIWSCEQSLKRLGLERIDLYLLHRPDYLCDPEEVAQAFSRLKQAGKVAEFGVSNFSPAQFAALQKACPMRLIANQVEISLMKLDCFHDGTLTQCSTEQITPMAWSPLGGGRLGASDPIDLRDADHARRLHIREVLDLIARSRETSRAVIAIAWLLKHPVKILPIVGSTDPERIRELTKAVDVHLTREEWYRLLEAALGHRLP
ncbi:MAG: aldo/keto reductase [Verrucomicrobia bacterium]|nr:aldo/keto reductase [Verrucomicrobiota bacterium]